MDAANGETRRLLTKLQINRNDHSFIYFSDELLAENFSEPIFTITQNVLRCLERYAQRRLFLVREKYPKIGDAVPAYFKTPALITAMCCPEGIVVLQEKNHLEGLQGEGILVGWSEEPLQDLVSGLSEEYVYLWDPSVDIEKIEHRLDKGPSIKIAKSAQGGPDDEFYKIEQRVQAHRNFDEHKQLPGRPPTMVDARAILELSLMGYEQDEKTGRQSSFVTRTIVEQAVKYHQITVLGPYESRDWTLSGAELWAEAEVMRSAVEENLRKESFNRIEPGYAKRKDYYFLIKKFADTIEKAKREEDLQLFLKAHPMVLDPTYSRVLPKVPFGKRVSDFVVQKITGEYVLVELEEPKKRMFKTKAKDEPSAELTHACNQLLDWLRYIEENLHTVRNELGLHGITTSPKTLIVMGRSRDLNADSKRKLEVMAKENPNRTIWTYDDLLDHAKNAFENIVGPLREDYEHSKMYYSAESIEFLRERIENI